MLRAEQGKGIAAFKSSRLASYRNCFKGEEMKAFFTRLGMVFSTGFILLYFSEIVFWSFWRPEDSLSKYFAMWLLYSWAAFVFLVSIEYFRVRTLWGLFLVAALFGWLIEGVVVMTFFGAEIPFPVTISWTGLAWHALISVLVGWYGIFVVFSRKQLKQRFFLASGIGAFWGYWAHTWTLESPPIFTNGDQFFIFSCVMTTLLVFSVLMYSRLSQVQFHSSISERIIVLVPLALLLLFVTIPGHLILSITVFLPLVGLVFVTLYKNRWKWEGECMTRVTTTPLSLVRLTPLLVIPVFSTLFYVELQPVADRIFPHVVVFLITTVLGFIFLLVSLVKVWGFSKDDDHSGPTGGDDDPGNNSAR